MSHRGRSPRALLLLGLAVLLGSSRLAAQSVNEFPVAPAVIPSDLAKGSDGNFWFTDVAGKVARMTPAGVVTEFTPPTTNAGAQGIVAGPDGNLWLAEPNGNRIGRLTTAGVFTEFPLPQAGSGPNAVCVGPDGALWFTEKSGNRIGRITTAGVVTNEFTVPTVNAWPNRIVAGPDGNLWFTEYAKTKIGRLTPAGVFTEFPIPSATAYPEGITAGPDGNLWFAENGVGKIGRITPAGTITEFPLPGARRIFNLTSGPDGNLWVPDFDNNKIARLTPTGTATEFLIPTADCGAYAIVFGPDSNPWFTEFKASKIAQFVIGGPPPPQIGGEYALPGVAIPQDIAAGPDGNLWLTDVVPKVARLSPGGSLTTFAAPGGPIGIAAGPDGNVWLAENGANKVGRMTTSGNLTEFPIPSTAASPTGIAWGPDGAMWFTETGANNVGRITTAGSVTEFPVITANSWPKGIAAAGDGNLWFTEYAAGKIGRMTTSGAVTEFPVPTTTAYLEGITLGADGNVWFCENISSQIGRVTPAGIITEFPLPTTSRLYHVAAGPDGNLWYAGYDSNRIGRMSTAGAVKEYLIPTAVSGPYGITAGPDGKVWFTEYRVGQAGWIAPDPPAFPVTAVAPTSGPAAGGSPVSITGSGFAANATVLFALAPASGVSVPGATSASATTPRLTPGTLNDVVVTNPATGAYGRLANGWLANFTDVPQSHPLHDFIEKLIRDGVSAGCGNGGFCPNSPVTRAQMAVFLLRSKNGAAYLPPACATPAFTDVPCSSPFAAWVNRLAALGVTTGCGGGDYCPGNPVTRAQMAVFLLRTHDGPSYLPPPCTVPTFADVPCSSGFASWVDELAARGITAGCGGGGYCPSLSVTRGQMAVFLVTTFGLP